MSRISDYTGSSVCQYPKYYSSGKQPGVDVLPAQHSRHAAAKTSVVPNVEPVEQDDGEHIIVRRPHMESTHVPKKRPLNAFMIDPKYLNSAAKLPPKKPLSARSTPTTAQSQPRAVRPQTRPRQLEPVLFHNAIAAAPLADRIRRPRLTPLAATPTTNQLYDDRTAHDATNTTSLVAAATTFLAHAWHVTLQFTSAQLHALRVRHTRLTYTVRQGVMVHDTEAWVRHIVPAALVIFVGFTLIGAIMTGDGNGSGSNMPAPSTPNSSGSNVITTNDTANNRRNTPNNSANNPTTSQGLTPSGPTASSRTGVPIMQQSQSSTAGSQSGGQTGGMGSGTTPVTGDTGTTPQPADPPVVSIPPANNPIDIILPVQTPDIAPLSVPEQSVQVDDTPVVTVPAVTVTP